jgi:hypothetical protein
VGGVKLLRRWLAWKAFRWILLAGVLVFALAQAIPYGRSHRNPPVRTVIRWDSPRTERLARGACLDCHSNLTVWPWYSNVAPISWLVQHDVEDGRSALNLSTLDLRSARGSEIIGEVGEKVRSGEMPPLQYKLVHGAARLSGTERTELADGLLLTLQAMARR